MVNLPTVVHTLVSGDVIERKVGQPLAGAGYSGRTQPRVDGGDST